MGVPVYYVVGPTGGGKSHLAAAIALALVENGWRVLFMRTSDLVQRLQIARRELALESALAKLDKYHLLILDDIVYVSKDQAETSVLFELIGSRYERRSMLITANQPFGVLHMDDIEQVFAAQVFNAERNAAAVRATGWRQTAADHRRLWARGSTRVWGTRLDGW